MEKRLVAYIKDELVPGYDGALDAKTPLLEEGVLDSMRVMRLLSFLEEEFEVVVDTDDFDPENFESISAICDMVARKKS